MATVTIKTPPRQIPELSDEHIEVPPPDPLPEQTKGPMMMRIVPLLIGGMMIAFLVMIVMSGSRVMSPMMMMAPMGMMMASLAYLGVGGPGGGPMGDVDTARNNYQLKLKEQRGVAHSLSLGIHTLHRTTYPHPLTLASRCGREGMWSITPRDSKLPPGVTEDASPEALRAWLTARVGVGVTKVLPEIEEPPTEIPEKLEPVTAGAFRRFLRTQKFVTNCPLGISFAEQEAYSFRGDPEAAVALGRAMICSLAFNHSPNDVIIGVICEPRVAARWDWLKWLPNAQDPSRRDGAGSARYAWSSVAAFLADEELGAGSSDGPHLLVFVDTPNQDVSVPPGWTRAKTTLVVLNAPSESLTTKQGRFHVSANREFSTPRKLRIAHADGISVTQARVIAQKMSRFRPPGWAREEASTDTADIAPKSYFDVLGITDVDTWDPRPKWEQNAWDSQFEIPIGFIHDGRSLTSDVFTMNFAEASQGGTGPHGCFQGKTGSGKSFLLMGIVGTLCTWFGPDKLNLILMDFKGGSTFAGFEKLPHVTANISNLDSAADLVSRTGVVINGEIRNRERLMKKLGLKDIVEYRKARAKNPDKYPPLPELIVVMDEFKEYMQEHAEELSTFVRIGTVGRAWGIHVWPCSQDIDQALLRGLVSHLSFGISLRSSDAAHSRFVIQSDEAVKLPMGQGQAIAYRENRKNIDDPERVRIAGFNVEQPYVAPRRSVAGAAARTRTVTDTRLSSFTLQNTFAATESDEQVSTQTALPAANVDDLPKMKDALIDRLAQFDEVKAVQLWQPTLRAPISYADLTIPPASGNRLEFQIGITDAPFEHKRLPYVIHPQDAGAHIRIIGQGGSGRSTAVEAIVAGALQSYSPRFCSFYLIDYAGAKLSEIAGLPNVGGYAPKTDEDAISRFIGEFFRVLTIRERAFGARSVATLDDYFADRETNPSEGDPYGHMFLVFDGFSSYLADHEGARESFLRLLDNGARFGLHMVVTALSNSEIPMKMHKYFGTSVHMAVQDVNESFVMGPTKGLVQRLPSEQPGRCVDFTRQLEARVVVPQFEAIEPIDEADGMPVYDYRASYSAGIAKFVQAMQQRFPDPEQRAVLIQPAPPVIDYQIIWDLYDGYARRVAEATPSQPGRRAAMDKHLPLAISTEDLRVVTVPDHTSPHLLAVGATQSGKTTMLRNLINSIVQQFSAEDAQIVIIESRMALLAEQQKLAEAGYLMAYADRNSLGAAVEKIKAAIEPRFPKLDGGQGLSAQAMQNRSWYSGPEVFVLIDGALTFTGSGFGMNSPLDPLLELMTRNDLGLHVYATGPANGFSSTRQANKLYKALAEAQTTTLLLSGPADEGTVWPGSGIKFALRRPGQAALVDPENMRPEVVQIGLARPWDEDNLQ